MMQEFMIHHEFTTLGGTIRTHRKARNLSQEAFAKICGLQRTYICDVERGARNVTVGTLLKIANALETTVSELTRNLENNGRSPEKSQILPYMNSAKLLIAVAVLFLGAFSAQAQNILEGVALESAVLSSILQVQVGSADFTDDALPGGGTPGGSHKTVFLQTSIASNAGQTGQLKFPSTNCDDASASVTATPEPSSLLLFGFSGLAVVLY
jgi:transcriptional regulator with XRE-family HTH domain